MGYEGEARNGSEGCLSVGRGSMTVLFVFALYHLFRNKQYNHKKIVTLKIKILD